MLTGAPRPLGSGDSHPVSGAEAQTRIFFERVLAPASAGAYINLHRPWKAPSGKTAYPGQAFDSAESAAAHIHRANWFARKNATPYEQHYHCISTQGRADPKTSAKGNHYLAAIRAQTNVVGVRSIFADIDVKQGAFASQADALRALAALVQNAAIPAPTMVVNSGGGLHAYWALNRALTHDEWTPLAEGFGRFLVAQGIHQDKIFGNSACLLRPPGSWNMKDPANPRQVQIIGRVLSNDYDSSVFQPFLPYRNVVALGATAGGKSPRLDSATTGNPAGTGAPATAQVTAPTSHTQAGSNTGAGVVNILPRLPAITTPGEMSAGFEHVAQPVSVELVVERCAVLKDVLTRGGNGDPEPFWRQVVLATTFDPNGRAWAHKFSSGDPRYTTIGVDSKFDGILNQRAQAAGKIGWPTCATFSKHSNACQQCPYNGRIKTPFHIAPDNTDLPKGYSRKDGVIWKDRMDEGGNGEAIPGVAFPYGLRDAYLESAPEGLVLNIELIQAHDSPRRVRFPVVAINSWRDKIHGIFGQAGIALARSSNHAAQEFMVAFVQHLQAATAASSRRDAVGWTKTRDMKPGFAFGGKVWGAAGRFENTSGIDPVLEDRYRVAGDMQPWRDAADFITRMGRVELQVILASAFAGPLVKYTGQSGLLLSAYSPLSGVQKSTAMQVAQAVWGHPIRAMNRLDDTYNSVANKLGVIRHLPLYWDELQTREQAEAGFSKLAFTLTQGTEKSRLGSDAQQRFSGAWATMLVSASNFSVQDMMAQEAKNTAAGLNRVFEVVVPPPPAGTMVSVAQASAIVSRCQENYGHAGEAYAKALARDEALLKGRLLRIAAHFEALTLAPAEERFWVFTAATIFLGAVLAKAEGLVDFDLAAMQSFLAGAIRAQRGAKIATTFDVTGPDYAASTLSRYIHHCRSRNAYLETNLFSAPRMGNTVAAIEIRMSDESRRALRAPAFHLARDLGVARFLRQEFGDWLAKEGIPARAVIEGLQNHGGMQNVRPNWASGTEWAVARVYCYEVSLTGGPMKHDAVGNLFGYGLKPGAINGAPITGVTTGNPAP
jgi:hypothetical protein